MRHTMWKCSTISRITFNGKLGSSPTSFSAAGSFSFFGSHTQNRKKKYDKWADTWECETFERTFLGGNQFSFASKTAAYMSEFYIRDALNFSPDEAKYDLSSIKYFVVAMQPITSRLLAGRVRGSGGGDVDSDSTTSSHTINDENEPK